MRILLISQYFFPETGATSNRVFSLAKKFKEEGHDVRVLAEKSNHPEGFFFEGFEDGFFLDREYKGVPVTYTWVYTSPEKGFLGRIFFYVSFMITAIMASLRLRGTYDIVCASSPPLFVGISGWVIAVLKRAKFVFDVRDLWPDVAVKMGELNNKMAISVAEKIEHFLYKRAHLITVVTESFKRSIGQKGINEAKIDVIPNGTDPQVFSREESKVALRKKLEMDDKFWVSYIGNIGLAQGLDHIIDSAKQIGHNNSSNISFLIVGDGPRKKELEAAAAYKNISNILFIDRVPLDTAVDYMNASDALLVPLGNDPIYSQFIPSKLFDSMAASKPVLLSVDGEARSILDKAQSGIYYEAENAEELTESIYWLKEHPEEAEIKGKRGRDFVTRNYTREVNAGNMLDSFKKLLINN